MTARAWIAVMAVGLGTWAMRAGLVLLLGRIEVPRGVTRSFRYVAPAVMAAIAVPAFVAPTGRPELSVPHLLAGVTAAAVAHRFGSFLATLVVGLAVFAAASAVM